MVLSLSHSVTRTHARTLTHAHTHTHARARTHTHLDNGKERKVSNGRKEVKSSARSQPNPQ